MTALLIACALLGFAGPQAGAAATTPAPSTASFPGGLPATFTGELPCADCPGTRHQLNLFADGVFYHRIVYIDRRTNLDQIGRWRLTSDGKILALTEPSSFAVVDDTTLRQLDREGRPIQSTLNFDLRRQTLFAPLEPRLRMDGMYRSTKEGGRFQECATGRDMPVVPQRVNRELEAAYAKAAAEKPGEPVLVSIDARLVAQGRTARENAVLLRQFIRIQPGAVCPPPGSAP
ncbi:MAG TPA: copper resistance protein NlpE N-terminal domain-containing protein [Thermoanaerobaculia bacterium]